MTAIDYRDVTAEQWGALADCFWGPPDQERYSCETPDDAVEHILDDWHPTSFAEMAPGYIVAKDEI